MPVFWYQAIGMLTLSTYKKGDGVWTRTIAKCHLVVPLYNTLIFSAKSNNRIY